MNLPDLGRWVDPRHWPWIFWVWIAFAAIGSAPKLWQRIRRRIAESWPSVSAQIERTEIRPPGWSINRSRGPLAELKYSYSVTGRYYSGTFAKNFATEEEAHEFLRDLQGKSTFVRYDPDRPERSMLLPQDLETLLTTRSAVANPDEILVSYRNNVPAWSLPFLNFFLALAGLGFLVSLWVHIGALFGVRVVPEYFFMILHVGIFVVFVPAIVVSQRLVGNTSRSDFWKVMSKDLPLWLRCVVYGSFGYAFLNFFLFTSKAPVRESGANPPTQVWRGFSGHWMLFYSASFAMLYAATIAKRSRRPT